MLTLDLPRLRWRAVRTLRRWRVDLRDMQDYRGNAVHRVFLLWALRHIERRMR